MTDYCFDITEELGERAVDIALGYIGDDLSMCVVRKSIGNGEHMAAMWCVENGLHDKKSIVIVKLLPEDRVRAVDYLWIFYKDTGKDMSGLKFKIFRPSSQGEFWSIVNNHKLSGVISKSRVSAKMRRRISNESEVLG